MKNVFRLAFDDIKRLFSSTITVIIVLGLVLLPSLFTWYNVLACWDVFNNTGNLKVAVANTDEGYQSELVPLRVTIGEQVVSALRANDQMDWEFTSEEEAIEGVRSGRYYAAVVIPPSFSADMMTFYSKDMEHASLTYYSNEKKNAIAPKVTGQGADAIAAQVNRTFAQTLTEVALGVSSALLNYLDNADASGALQHVAANLDDVGTDMEEGARAVRLYAQLIGSTRVLIDGSGGLLSQSGELARATSGEIADARTAASEIPGALDDAADAFAQALAASAEGFEGVPQALDAAFDSALATSASSADSLRTLASDADARIASYQEVVSRLEAALPSMPEESQPALQALIDQLNASISLQADLRDSLVDAASALEAGGSDAQVARDEAKGLAAQAYDSLQQAKATYDDSVAPTLAQLSEKLEYVVSALPSVASLLESAGSDLSASAESISARMGEFEQTLTASADDLEEQAANMRELSSAMAQALEEGDASALREVLSSDPASLAQDLSAPIQLERQAVYPVDNFGSAMSPLYTTLALWIGALLIMVALKMSPSHRALTALDSPTSAQLFAGRFVTVAALSLLQSTCMGLGCLLFLGVQADNPALYLLCLWVSGLVFAFIIYTLVATFGNFGKALSVLLLIVQVSGGGGSYPLALLPDFFQAVSPFLPITHAVNAMRAAMFGVYMNDFWAEIGVLLGFALPFIVLGFVLRKPLAPIVQRFVEKVESTKVM
ncbi:MAG TPA: YhgE/Pip domain-containing protein [Candidatus Aphodovivens excrementavium]|nr:YhgE/Pip domain-containing protein [Candidatus Aphodovivens excrementavium]